MTFLPSTGKACGRVIRLKRRLVPSVVAPNEPKAVYPILTNTRSLRDTVLVARLWKTIKSEKVYFDDYRAVTDDAKE